MNLSKEMRDKYRIVFSRDDYGREVFIDLLERLGFFDEIVIHQENITLQNFARFLLKATGILKEVNKKLFVEELFMRSSPD